MEDHRIGRDQLLSLQLVGKQAGCARKIESGKLFIDHIEPFDRATMVVLVVANDRSFRHAPVAAGIASTAFHDVCHGSFPMHGPNGKRGAENAGRRRRAQIKEIARWDRDNGRHGAPLVIPDAILGHVA